MHWNILNTEAQVASIKQESVQQPILIFKHSTRCSISATSLNRLERKWREAVGIKPYLLDLIAFRTLSNKVVEEFGVWHESPQVLLIQNGECVYHASHFDIEFDSLQEQVILV